MPLLAIDPGTEKSGWALLEEDGTLVDHGWEDNGLVLSKLGIEISSGTKLLIEDVSHYGMPVGRDVFETVKWMGRFDILHLAEWITRPDIKLALCGSVTATDSNVRQAVIDWYGGDEKAIGGKKCPDCKGKGWKGRDHKGCATCHHMDEVHKGKYAYQGCGYQTHSGPLYGVSGHVWSALALGIAYIERSKQ